MKNVLQTCERQLYVKRSLLPKAGKGLFTSKPISKSSLVIEYKGRVRPWKEIQDSEIFNGYVFYISRNRVVDAMKRKTALARYANDARGLSKVKSLRNNAVYVVKQNRVFIKATRNIPAGAEILVSYGQEYWTSIRHNKKTETKSKTKKAA